MRYKFDVTCLIPSVYLSDLGYVFFKYFQIQLCFLQNMSLTSLENSTLRTLFNNILKKYCIHFSKQRYYKIKKDILFIQINKYLMMVEAVV